MHDRMALLRSRRPPVVVSDASAATGWTVLSSVLFSSAVSSVQRESTSAAAPETCGVAIDVPLEKLYVLPMVVDRMSTPGAPRSTEAAP